MTNVYAFSFFHLNLCFSAIEDVERETVIARAYWPLLDMIDNLNVCVGIELSAYTLEQLVKLDRAWVEKFSVLLGQNKCELIGSGYAQIIGPLVPNLVLKKNLQVGHDVYKKILGVEPTIALVNEQAFSAGIVSAYEQCGYEALIVELENASLTEIERQQTERLIPQFVRGNDESVLPVIWNSSVSFQKFQRYAHGESSFSEITDYILKKVSEGAESFSIYGSDAEVFNYRPGRYKTEHVLDIDNLEWSRIRRLYSWMVGLSSLSLVSLREALAQRDNSRESLIMDICSADHPIQVKKQPKYNVVRWAVTGKADAQINTRCWKIYQSLTPHNGHASVWKKLLYLWSSDFRTHITSDRWSVYLSELSQLEEEVGGNLAATPTRVSTSKRSNCNIERRDNELTCTAGTVEVKVNLLRGMAVESFIDRNVSNFPLMGSIQHGYFSDIKYGVDFFSGHFCSQRPGEHKVTDLLKMEPIVRQTRDYIELSASWACELGDICKSVRISSVDDSLVINWRVKPRGPLSPISLRYGYLTLKPRAFPKDQLYFKTHNGGASPEIFQLGNQPVNHGAIWSPLVSAKTCLGLTEGFFAFGDGEKELTVNIAKPKLAAVGLVEHQEIGDACLTRFCLTASEFDDTSRSIDFEEIVDLDLAINARKCI